MDWTKIIIEHGPAWITAIGVSIGSLLTGTAAILARITYKESVRGNPDLDVPAVTPKERQIAPKEEEAP